MPDLNSSGKPSQDLDLSIRIRRMKLTVMKYRQAIFEAEIETDQARISIEKRKQQILETEGLIDKAEREIQQIEQGIENG